MIENINIKELKDSKKTLEDYVFGEMIGEGAYSIVREGINKKSCRRVAVKIIQRSKENDVRLEKELYQKSLVHKNICQMYVSFRDENIVYLILEFVPSGSLHELIKTTKISMCEVWYFIVQILEGLDYLHTKRNISHRDLKPQNLLLTVSRGVKIVDFGDCHKCEDVFDDKSLDSTCGTNLFFSPQMAEGVEYSTKKSDIWASGVTLFLMLGSGCGELKYPFFDENLLPLMEKIKEGKYDVPEEVEKEELLLDFLSKFLEVNEEKRWSASKLLNHDWVRINRMRYEAEIKEMNEKSPFLFRWKSRSIIPAIKHSLKRVPGEDGVPNEDGVLGEDGEPGEDGEVIEIEEIDENSLKEKIEVLEVKGEKEIIKEFKKQQQEEEEEDGQEQLNQNNSSDSGEEKS